MKMEQQKLKLLLRPAGAGIHVVSTGLHEQQELQKKIYHVDTADEIQGQWLRMLDTIAAAKVIILGVPSDVGAGFNRGANRGPAEIRRTMLADPSHPYHDATVVDVGDIFTVPHLLTDEMLSSSQRKAVHGALYGTQELAVGFPVTPLGMCEYALGLLRELNPKARPIVIGGDHSVAWPAFSALYNACASKDREQIGLLHFDAHTDLLENRLGVKICFATWAYHANALMGDDGRLVQVGIRASAHERAHWESQFNIKQYWAKDVAETPVQEVAAEITERFNAAGVTKIYVSNDIDGTSSEFAAATGTPEPMGLHPDFVRGLVQSLCTSFTFVGGDLVEVAPTLAGEIPGEPARTLATASSYMSDLINAGLGDRMQGGQAS
jgi:agmatinase